MFEKHLWMKHSASKNQLPGLSVSGTLVKNGLNCITLDQGKLATITDISKKTKNTRIDVKEQSTLNARRMGFFLEKLPDH